MPFTWGIGAHLLVVVLEKPRQCVLDMHNPEMENRGRRVEVVMFFWGSTRVR